MQIWALRTTAKLQYSLLYLLLLAPFVGGLFTKTYAIPQVAERFDKISTSEAGAIATHQIGFTYTDLINQVGSVNLEFCSNSPIPEVACVAPTGLDVSFSNLVNQTGQTGFTIDNGLTTTNKIVLTRTPASPTAGNTTSVYEFENIINPDTAGSYYVRIQTFASTDATGSALEDGGVVFAITTLLNVSAEVPPFLLLCTAVTIEGMDCDTATSFFIDLGELSSVTPKTASSQLISATNASYGYNVTLAGTSLVSGNNIIPALVNRSSSSTGTSQFGLNLRSNSNPTIGANPTGPGTAAITTDYGQPNQFKFVPGDAVISTATTSDFRKFTASYLINVSKSQSPGIYATTVSFVALANF